MLLSVGIIIASDKNTERASGEMKEKLLKAIEDKSYKVGIIGLGYVGLPLARAFFDAGFSVMGFDVDPAKVESLDKGENYLKHLGEDYVKEMSKSDRFIAVASFDRLDEPDALIACVPTPLGKHLDPDLSYVEKTTEAIAKKLRPGQLVTLESTTYPGTTRDVMLPVLEKSGLKAVKISILRIAPSEKTQVASHTTRRLSPS